MKNALLASICLAALLPVTAARSESAASPAADSVEALRTALSESSRADADKARDAGRKPADVVRFLGFQKGAKVIDVIAASGYYTEVLSIAVGSSGKVYAQNPAFVLQFREGANDKALTARLADGRLANVTRWDRELASLGLGPRTFDGALTALNFHDVHNRDPEAATRMLATLKSILKPGGILGIIDHVGEEGNDNASLHRIPKATVIEAATAAGFEIAGDSDLLANPADDHTAGVFGPETRGKTDRFLLKLRKPQ